MFIWFNLLALFNGQVFWVQSFENLEECQIQQIKAEAEHPGVKFWCPYVKVQKT